MERRTATSLGPAACACLLFVLLFACPPPCVTATGKGPVGSYAINHQYILVSDSNFDSLFVVDVLNGSGVVATIPLHASDLDPPNDQPSFGAGGDDHMKAFKYWVDPTGVASCDKCKFIFFTSQKEPNLGYIELERPLLEMASVHDFSSLENLEEKPNRWQQLWSDVESSAIELLRQSNEIDQKYIDDFRPSKFRMLEIHRDGCRGYLSHYDLGVFTFTLDMSNGGMFDDFVGFLPLSDASSISGLTLTPGDTSALIITAKTKAYVADVPDKEPLMPRITQTIELQNLCGIKFKDGRELPMNFRDAVMDGYHGDIYAIGKPYGSSGTKEEGFGAVLFRLSKNSSGTYNDCANVANKLGNGRGWRDGHAEEVRFTRPHSMIRLPDDGQYHTMLRDVFILPDIDNRGMRRVDLDEDGIIEVSSVQYDENLWRTLYVQTNEMVKGKADVKALIIEDDQDSLRKKNFATYTDASLSCTSTATSGIRRRLCLLNELRDSFEEIKDALRTAQVAKAYVQAWSNNPCHGCWLHYPGFCKDGEGWDDNYRMVVRLNVLERDQLRIRSECVPQDESTDVIEICCEDLGEEGGEEEVG